MIAAAPSEAKNTAVAPISEGSNKRFIHCLPKIWWFNASSTVVPSCSASFGNCFSINAVRVGPGKIELAVIPCCAFSSAITFVRPIWPYFAAT